MGNQEIVALLGLDDDDDDDDDFTEEQQSLETEEGSSHAKVCAQRQDCSIHIMKCICRREPQGSCLL